MSSENNFTIHTNYNMESVEEEVIKALQKKEYTLNTVNSYGENLLHFSAANGCLNITKEILQKQDYHVIDRKNKFGWTPLMLAIRNRHIETAKFFLEKDANVNKSTYLGMSIFGLAAAINEEMFEVVYKACPSELLNSANDDITPLCIAAMKNDKNLFFKLLKLGFDICGNEYTQIMMKQSTVPEIANLAKKVDIEDYWNDTSDNISIESTSNKTEQLPFLKSVNESQEYFIKTEHSPEKIYDPSMQPVFVFNSTDLNNDDYNNNVMVDLKKSSKPCKLNLMIKYLEPTSHSIISPTLTCDLDEILPASPHIYFVQNDYNDKINVKTMNNVGKQQFTEVKNKNECMTEVPLQRLQSIRPPDLHIQTDCEDLDTTLSYIPEFSPIRSPNVPPDINDENVFGENTPTPPHYRTPPRGMILNSEEAKMFVLLRRYGLSQHVPIFLQQEVDIGLFMTLTDEDLIEIGIKDKSDRKAILDVIMDYKKLIV